MTTPAPLVTAIVTTRNSAQTLRDCLESIRSQTYEAVETIVVDNASSDQTVAIATELADFVLSHGPERSAQRNLGVQRAAGAFVLVIDSDMVLEPGVVTDCVAAATQGAAAVTIPETSIGYGLWGRAKTLERSCYVGDETIEAPRFFRRSTFIAYGGYDEQLTGPEDWDLPARMRGHEQFARSDAGILHLEGRPTLRELARKKFYYGQGFARYISRNPALAARQIAFVRPAYIRNWRMLLRTPGLTAAMFWMKGVEYAAGGAGLSVAAARRVVRRGR